ncbi:MAG: 30S ribosomal protein S7, partial [Victivallales bacterium]|nr:30S ribosomal protein S7 [Victivallales bacterium]
ENVKPRLEVKSRRVGGATYQVPLEVPAERQTAVALRWIVSYARARKGVPMAKSLAAELTDAFNGTGNAVKKRDDVHKMAKANQAFAHYRF